MCRERLCQKSHVTCGRQKNIGVRVRRSGRDEGIFLALARPGEGSSYASQDRYSMREVSSRGRRENERTNADVGAVMISFQQI